MAGELTGYEPARAVGAHRPFVDLMSFMTTSYQARSPSDYRAGVRRRHQNVSRPVSTTSCPTMSDVGSTISWFCGGGAHRPIV